MSQVVFGKNLKVLRVVGGAFALWLVAGCGLAWADPMKIVVSQGGQGISYTPFYIAQEKGFFVEENLDVVTTDIAGIQQLVVIGNDQSNLSPGTLFSIISTGKGRPMINIASSLVQQAADVVLSNDALAKAKISPGDPFADRMKALRGMRIGLSSHGSATDMFMRFLLPRYGLQPDKDVTLITLGSCVAMLAAMQSGSVDGFVCAPPAPQQAEASGFGKVLISSMSGEVPDVRDILTASYFGKPEYIKKNPQVIQAFVNGLTKGLRFVHEHPDEAAAIVAKYQPGLEPAVFNKTFKIFINAFPKTAVTDVTSMQRYIDLVRAATPDLPPIDAASIVDNSFAERAAEKFK